MRFRYLAAAVTMTALLGAACSDDDDAADASGEDAGEDMDGMDTGADGADGADFNDADVTFAVNMIPHHEQAVEMSQLAPDRAADERVIDLAARIEAAQTPEIEQMRGFLEEFGEDEDMGDMDMDTDAMAEMDGMAGMLSADELAALEEGAGVDFDLLYLEGMIAHHDGAIDMAEAELAEGEYAEALELAQVIRSTQEDETAEMEALLADIETMASSGRG